MTDLSKKRADYAVFLPAVSGFYTEIYGRSKTREGYLAPERMPKGFEHGLESLNFLQPETGAFFYDRCLYSAGHAYLNIDRSNELEGLVQDRHESVICVGDSGGFQVGKGHIKFDWERFFEKEGDPGYVGKADKVRSDIQNWLEYTAEWSMTLDVPTWATDHSKIKEVKKLTKELYELNLKEQTTAVKEEIKATETAIKKLNDKMTGLMSFDDCLKATLHNLDYFRDHAQGKTKYLNVLQGTKFDEATAWYNAVKDYDFCEGWAMGGNNIRDISFALKRLLIMRDEGYLENKNWIHFLGTSKLDWACMLTAIQRQLRKHVNPNITISFDCASPFIATANGLIYTHNINTPERFSYIMQGCFDNKLLKGSESPFPFEGAIGDRLTLGDICYYGPDRAEINGKPDFTITEDECKELAAAGIDAKWVLAETNKLGKEGKTSWDSVSYAIIMAHNVEQHIKSVQRSNQLADIEHLKHRADWRNWKKTKRKDQSQEISNWVPVNVLMFMTFVEELFVAEDPYKMLDEAELFLDDLSNNKQIDKENKEQADRFTSLFGEDEDDDDTSNDDAGLDSDLLDSMEHTLREE